MFMTRALSAGKLNITRLNEEIVHTGGRVDPNKKIATGRSNKLSGVVACLSGQSVENKEWLTHVVHELGGGHVVERFDEENVTHLILDSPNGTKYRYWTMHSTTLWAKSLSVVTSYWLIACHKEGRRVQEGDFLLKNEDTISPDVRIVRQNLDGKVPHHEPDVKNESHHSVARRKAGLRATE